jgi:hypothetical protein
MKLKDKKIKVWILSLFVILSSVFGMIFIFAQSVNPDHIHLTISDALNADTTMHITWRTDTSVTQTRVKYGLSAGSLTNEATGTYSDAIPGARIHDCDLSGLTPDTTYYYQVGSVSAWSGVYSFKTAPTFNNFDSMKFVVWGDTRTNQGPRLDVLDEIYDEMVSGAKFAIHTGDIVEDSNDLGEWNEWFGDVQSRQIGTGLPIMSVRGNHDDSGTFYDTLHYNPHNGPSGDDLSYYFVYGTIFFISLDYKFNELPGSADQLWLDQVLALANNMMSQGTVHWILSYAHKPPYNSGISHGEDDDYQAYLCPKLENNNVDVLFGGHEHTYERTYPIKGGSVVTTSDNLNWELGNNPATIYMVAGGGGAPRTPLFCFGLGPQSYSAETLCDESYAVVTVSYSPDKTTSTLLVQGKDDSGVVFDSGVSITKNNLPNNQLPTVSINDPSQGATVSDFFYNVSWTQSVDVISTKVKLNNGPWTDNIYPATSQVVGGLLTGNNNVTVQVYDGQFYVEDVVSFTFNPSPSVSITSPTNDTVLTDWVYLNWVQSADVTSSRIKLNNDPWSPNQFPNTYYNVTGLADDTYNYIKVNVSDGFSTGEDDIIMYYASAKPAVFPHIRKPNSDIINVSGAYLNFSDVKFEWSSYCPAPCGSINGFNLTLMDKNEVPLNSTNLGPSATSLTYYGVADEEYKWKIVVNSTSGKNQTKYLNFTVDTTFPQFNLTEPYDTEILTTNNVTFKWTFSDTNADKMIMTLNNITYGTFNDIVTNQTYMLDEGNYTVQCKAYDLAGNINESQVYIQVDLEGPEILCEDSYVSSQQSGIGGGGEPLGWVYVNWTCYDIISGMDYSQIRIKNSTGWSDYYLVSPAVSAYNFTDLQEGVYDLEIICFDKIGYNNTRTSSAHLDFTPPIIYLIGVVNKLYDSDVFEYSIYYTVGDSVSGIQRITLYYSFSDSAQIYILSSDEYGVIISSNPSYLIMKFDLKGEIFRNNTILTYYAVITNHAGLNSTSAERTYEYVVSLLGGGGPEPLNPVLILILVFGPLLGTIVVLSIIKYRKSSRSSLKRIKRLLNE